MKKYLLTLCAMLIAFSQISIAQTTVAFGNTRKMQSNKTAIQQKLPTPTDTIKDVNGYGLLYGPDGSDWTYTTTFTKQGSFYNSVTVKIYDNNNKLIGEFTDDLQVEDQNNEKVIGVNYVDVNPNISQRFFNTDENYEIMLFMHAVTENYTGRYINKIYSLNTTTEKIYTVNGAYQMSLNTSTNNYSESYTMIFQREVKENDSTFLYYDIYSKATMASQTAPILEHTFKVNYANIASSGQEPSPILLVQNGDNPNYVITQYEKPYFTLKDINSEPEVNLNNNLIISYYDHEFALKHTTKIPVELSLQYLYSFYALGSLNLNQDVIVNYNNTNKPAYIITIDNYQTESDNYISSYYLYDADGKKIKTIAENATGYIPMSNIVGQPTQIAFLKEEGTYGKFTFIDFPEISVAAEFSIVTPDETILSTNIDRYPVGDSYQYVTPKLMPGMDKDKNLIHDIAWIKKDGTIDHYETITLGKNIENAILYIEQSALNPYLFNDDAHREYMAIVYRAKANSTKKEEVLLVCNTNGETILEYGPDADSDNTLATVYLINQNTNPNLLCVYYDDNNSYSLRYTPLPLDAQKNNGDGSIENPYRIKTVNDFKRINDEPNAHYIIVNDLDFMSTPFNGIEANFTGSLNGNNYTIHNLVLENNALFHSIKDSAVVKNIRIDAPTLNISNKYISVAILANNLMGGLIDDGLSENGTSMQSYVQNVHITQPQIIATDDFAGILGGLVGEASFYSNIIDCSLSEAQIEAWSASSIGGIAGTISTSSQIANCLFSGNIDGGNEIGGITSMASSNNKITNCHTNASIYGTKKIGGVIAVSDRARISNCFVEGSIELDASASEGRIGAIAAEVANSFTDTITPIIQNCIVNVESITIKNPAKKYIHRIAGYTSADTWEYNWDSIDYNEPQANWPKIYGTTEKCFKNNYVISALLPFDSNIATENTTTEGADYKNGLNTDWLTNLEYSLNDSPWSYNSNTGLTLWFELNPDGPITIPDNNDPVNIENNTSLSPITYSGETISANGTITLYSVNGIKVAQGLNNLSTSSISQGVYIVIVQGEKTIAQKIIIQ